MEAEFINVFIEKQRDTINEIMARNIMLETKSILAERSATHAAETLKKLSEAEGVIESLRTQNAVMTQVIDKNKPLLDTIAPLNNKITGLEKQLADCEKQIQDLHATINRLTLEKEAQRTKAERIKKKVQEISVE